MLRVFTGRKCENIISIVQESSLGPQLEGEDSTIEPTMRMQIRHLPVSDVVWNAIRVGGVATSYIGELITPPRRVY